MNHSANKRRQIITALGAGLLANALPALAQQAAKATEKMWRVGILANLDPADPLISAFTEGLRDLGYVEGRNLVIVRRVERGGDLDALAAEVVREKPDVIFAPNTVVARAAKKVAGTIPIVFAVAGDPVGVGFAASLARPGGNMTGTTNINSELSAKRLQLLKEAAPNIRRVAILDPKDTSPTTQQQIAEAERAAKILGIEVFSTNVGRREDFAPVAAQLRKWRADALYVTSNPTNTNNRQLLADFAANVRLPAMYGFRGYVEAGGFMSYGPNEAGLYRRAAYYVDRIFKGAKPADLPVEQPTKFELFINGKTAKALGLKIPQSLLITAEKVIE